MTAWRMKRRPVAPTGQGAGPPPTAGEGANRGQSLVELALSLPVLLLLLLGTIDFGRMFFDYVQMRNAAREGVGFAVRNINDPDLTAEVEARVQRHGIPGGTTVGSGCSSGDCFTVNGHGTYTVTAARTFTPIASGSLARFSLGSIPLRVTASMRVMT